MSIRRKITILGIAAALFICAAVVLLSYVTLDITRFSPTIAPQAARFGYKLDIEHINIKLLPEADISIRGVAISNADDQTITAQDLRLTIALLPLIFRKTVIRRIEADTVSLTTTTSRIKNLMKAKTKQRGEQASIDAFELRRLKLIINDAQSGANSQDKSLEVNVRTAQFHRDGEGFALTIEGSTPHGAEFTTSGRWDSQKQTIIGSIDARGMDIERLQIYLGLNLKKTVGLNGAADARLSYTIGPKTGINGKITLKSAQASLSALAKPLPLSGSAAVAASIEDGHYSITLKDITIDTGDFKVTGTMEAQGTAKGADFTAALSTTPIPLPLLKRLATTAPLPSALAAMLAKIEHESGTAAIEAVSASGSIRDGRLDTRQLIGTLQARIRLERAGFNYAGLSAPVKDVSGRVKFDKMTLFGEDIEGRCGNIILQNLSAKLSELTTNPAYDISLKGIFDINESVRLAAQLGEAGARLSSSLSLTRLSGGVNLSLNIKGRLNGMKAARYSGTARLKDITAPYGNTQSMFGPADANISFDNERITINTLNAAIGGSTLALSGYADNYRTMTASGKISISTTLTNETIRKYLWDNAPALRGALIIKADASGSLDEFSAHASVNTKAGIAGDNRLTSISNATLSAAGVKIRSGGLIEIESLEAWVQDGTAAGHIFKDLKASAKVTEDSVDGRLRLTIDDGEAFTSMRYYMKTDTPTAFDTDITLNGVKLEEILKAFNVRSNIISGPVFGTAVLSAKRGDGRILSRLSGSISLHADRGRLYKFLLLNKIFSIVNIISIDELFKEGLPYKTVTGDFTITDGVLATERFYLESDSMRMSALGKIDMTAPSIDSFVALRPFVTLDKIISSVPLAGWIITGKEQTIANFYYKIEGPLANPDVSPAPIKGIQEGISGILERLVTPEPEAAPEEKK